MNSPTTGSYGLWLQLYLISVSYTLQNQNVSFPKLTTYFLRSVGFFYMLLYKKRGTERERLFGSKKEDGSCT